MVETAKDKQYCPSCGEDVDTYNVDRYGATEVRCNYCGLTLESAVFDSDIKEQSCIMLAEDSELIREMLKDTLLEKKVTKKVVAGVNGYDFIARLTERFEKREPVDLAILDIQMPVMSGINAAVALRAVENGFEREKRRIPILFFSVKKCDEMLKKVMQFCAPAHYINKGTNDSKEALFNRVKQVIAKLLH